MTNHADELSELVENEFGEFQGNTCPECEDCLLLTEEHEVEVRMEERERISNAMVKLADDLLASRGKPLDGYIAAAFEHFAEIVKEGEL